MTNTLKVFLRDSIVMDKLFGILSPMLPLIQREYLLALRRESFQVTVIQMINFLLMLVIFLYRYMGDGSSSDSEGNILSKIYASD